MQLGKVETAAGESRLKVSVGGLAGAAGLTGVVATLGVEIVKLLAGLITNYFELRPERGFAKREFQVEALQCALQVKDSAQRASSVRLLIDAGVLDDKKGSLSRLAQRPQDIPHWDFVKECSPGVASSQGSEPKPTPKEEP